jgi:hypothetical protein
MISGIRKPATSPVAKASPSGKSPDSTDKSSSPEYENIWRRPKKKSTEKESLQEGPISPSPEQASAPEGRAFDSADFAVGKPLRLQTGWDQLLFAQKKICEKARGVMQILEAPKRYFLEKKSKIMSRKHQGVILDFTSAEHTGKLEEKESEENANLNKVA